MNMFDKYEDILRKILGDGNNTVNIINENFKLKQALRYLKAELVQALEARFTQESDAMKRSENL